jgi:hypothetical protein
LRRVRGLAGDDAGAETTADCLPDRCRARSRWPLSDGEFMAAKQILLGLVPDEDAPAPEGGLTSAR